MEDFCTAQKDQRAVMSLANVRERLAGCDGDDL